MKNANTLLFRASSMGAIMTGTGKGWAVDKSITCQRKLVQMHREIKWSRRADTGNKYTEKGITVEEDGLTLYSQYKKHFFVKNEIRLYNRYFKGELDTFIGEAVEKAQKTFDVKCSWDWNTFPSIVDKEPDDNYDYQGQTYMDLSGSEEHTVAYCLVNTPDFLITAEKRKLFYSLGVQSDADPLYVEQCKEVEKNCIVDMSLFEKHFPSFVLHNQAWDYDIPIEDRVQEVIVKRDNAKIERMKARVIESRNWMDKHLFKI